MPTPASSLPLTGERTVPGIPQENYWFRRHEAVYEWIVRQGVSGMVVEAGCGEGYGADLLSRAGGDVLAIDYDETTVEHVSARYDGLSVMQANLVDLPVDDAVADLVVSLQVIEHLWDLPGFLQEARRILRPGGQLVVSTPNRLTFSPGLGRGEQPTNPFHVEEFDAEQVEQMLNAAGFDAVGVLGLFHGPALAELEAEHGDLVQRQIGAVLGDEGWSDQLVADVTSVTVAEFDIREIAGPGTGGPQHRTTTHDGDASDAAAALDLIGVAHKAAR